MLTSLSTMKTLEDFLERFISDVSNYRNIKIFPVVFHFRTLKVEIIHFLLLCF